MVKGNRFLEQLRKNTIVPFFLLLLGILFIGNSVFAQEKMAKSVLKIEIIDGKVVNTAYLDSLNKAMPAPINENPGYDPDKAMPTSMNEDPDYDPNMAIQTPMFEIREPNDLTQEKGTLSSEKVEISEEIYSPAITLMEIDNDQVKKGKENPNIIEPQGWSTIMSQDFEGAFPATGWSAFASSGYTDAYWDDLSYRSYNGSWSAWCADMGSESSTPSSGYPNNMKAWMIYGPFSLSDANDAILSFYYWNESESCCDYFKWLASINGKNFYGYQVSGNSGGWNYRSFDLKNVPTLGDLTGEPQVWIAFLFTSDYSITYEGAYVDDIVLQKNVTSTAPDLIGTSISLSTTNWVVGNNVTADLTEQNIGGTTAGSHSSQLYLSTNTTITTSDTPLGTPISFSSISPGATQTQSKTFTVPDVSDGTYYVGVIIDIYDEVAESNENNAFYRVGTVTVSHPPAPDIRISPTSLTFIQSLFSAQGNFLDNEGSKIDTQENKPDDDLDWIRS